MLLYSLFYTFCSDWNGSKRGHVYKFLRSQGFESTYDTAHKYSDSDVDAHKVGILRFQYKFLNWLLWCHFAHIYCLFFYSGSATEITEETSAALISYGFAILINHVSH